MTLKTDQQLTDSSSKFESIIQKIKELTAEDPTVKIVIFSQWSHILEILEEELALTKTSFRSRLDKFYTTITEFKVGLTLESKTRTKNSFENISQFQDPNMNVTCLLLPLSYGSKGLNIIEATHVFFVEPILDSGEELQAIGRIHRIGQTKYVFDIKFEFAHNSAIGRHFIVKRHFVLSNFRKTYVHRFIVRNTVEETIHNTISNDQTGYWSSRKCTVENLMQLFTATDIKDDN